MSFLQKLQKTALQEAPAKFQGAKLQKSSGGFQKNGAKLILYLYFEAKCLARKLKKRLLEGRNLNLPYSPNHRVERNKALSRGRKNPQLYFKVGEERDLFIRYLIKVCQHQLSTYLGV